ncbi:hypothetical protein [Flavobacterium cerinum]|uniref:DUF4926 domain-containing protein n=1 Tax=Flavobacterium cerinum TaxID=2502784 RepID=A0A444HBU7_9FLAO|nr:hypothetical protein [Flavobacterium cerinum]RWX00939.1 hypothetical protein EPI11_07915 [Flavobacterium cerinum]
MKKTNKNIGKEAIIDCLTEQLREISITSFLPGTKVTIIKYDGYSDNYGDCYEVTDGMIKNFGYIIPRRWLNIIEE